MRAIVAALGVTAMLFAGCTSETDEFCALNEKLDQRSQEENIEPGTPEFVALIDRLADSAPAEIKADVQLVAEANRDPRSADVDAVRQADSNVEKFIDDNCD
jgi:PBP1b-binding outer membrane lipoprotein LpoB